MSHSPIFRTIMVIVLLGMVVGLQYGYDRTKIILPPGTTTGTSPELVRIVDFGFHSTVGSFLWIETLPEFLDVFFNGHTEYLTDLNFLNTVDPKLSYPYAFTVLTLPVASKELPNAEAIALAVGRKGIANADPDWRIPYYMGADYFLDLKDEKDALYYYNIAAQTPGIPSYAKIFAENFGAIPDERQQAEAFWETIAASTNDPSTKARAEAYVYHYQIFDYLQAAVNQYKKSYGTYPKTFDQVIAKGIIPGVPRDPFGFTFLIESGGLVGINETSTSE